MEPSSLDSAADLQSLEKLDSQSEEVLKSLFGDEIIRFLAELPEKYRRALVLCDVDGLSYRGISEFMDIPIGTVRSRISRARSSLRERLESYAYENGYLRQTRQDCGTG